MALSDYLTGPEWDACFFRFAFDNPEGKDLGSSMRETINFLLEEGYEFSGLDSSGNKITQVENGINAPKVCIFLGNPYNCNITEIFNSGREFLKEYLPEKNIFSDEEWEKMVEEADQQD